MASYLLAQALIDRTGMATGLDDAIFTSHWRKMKAGLPDIGPVGDGEADAGQVRLTAFWNAVKPLIQPAYVYRETRWYKLDDAAPYRARYFRTTLPAAAPGISGTGGGTTMPPQTAVTVTFKTAQRKHWGRFYLPGCSTNVIDTTTQGAVKQASIDTLAAAAHLLTDRGGVTDGACLTVFSTTTGTHWDPETIQVDNVWDVIRKRRMKKSTYKKTLAAG